uniref:Uncharacterized protein n=1 Tax=Lygus hesperus TaxID=30085 RepID=A0A0A9WC92_LYGHE
MALPLSCILLYIFYPIFNLHIHNVYQILPRGRTNSVSILINANLILTLIPPLAYNFYLLVNATQNVFFKIVGEMKLLPVFGERFHLYFPSLIVLAILFTHNHLFSKILLFLSIPIIQKNYDPSSQRTDEYLQDGIMYFRHYLRMLHSCM